MRERRQYERFSPAYAIETGNVGDNEGLTLVDISKGGVAVTSKQKPPQNTIFRIKIFLKARMFRLEAVIVYSTKGSDGTYRIGARFSSVPEGFEEAFDREIEEMKSIYREKVRTKKQGTFTDASKEYLAPISA